MTTRTVHSAGPRVPSAIGPYSPAVSWGGLLFCAGQTPVDPGTGELVDGGPAEQTRQCLRNLTAVCEAAGGHLNDGLRLTVYVTDLGWFGEINSAYAEFFDVDPPARATVEVAALPKAATVEIDAIVALG